MTIPFSILKGSPSWEKLPNFPLRKTTPKRLPDESVMCLIGDSVKEKRYLKIANGKVATRPITIATTSPMIIKTIAPLTSKVAAIIIATPSSAKMIRAIGQGKRFKTLSYIFDDFSITTSNLPLGSALKSLYIVTPGIRLAFLSTKKISSPSLTTSTAFFNTCCKYPLYSWRWLGILNKSLF